MRAEYFDEDLSVLTQLRIDNRKSKQRLLNKVLNDQTNNFSDLSITTSSPLKSYNRSSKRSPTKKSPKKEADKNEFDYTILSKDNQRYYDKELYELDQNLNQLKKERFLNSLKSPESSIRSKRNLRISPLKKDDSIYSLKNRYDLDDTFKNRNNRINSDIPKLQPTSNLKTYTSASPSSIQRMKQYYQDDDVFKNFKKLNLKEKGKESEIDKILNEDYNIYTNNNDDDDNDVNELKIRIKKLEQKLESYKEKLSNEINPNKEVIIMNRSLNYEIDQLNQFIKFLEDNFDKVYKKSHYYKLEKYGLHKTNQELQFINSYYKQQLKKYENLQDTSDEHGCVDDNDSTTYHLMSFQSGLSLSSSLSSSNNFQNLSSIKKFKAIGFLVLSVIKLRKRASQREKFYRKLSEYMV